MCVKESNNCLVGGYKAHLSENELFFTESCDMLHTSSNVCTQVNLSSAHCLIPMLRLKRQILRSVSWLCIGPCCSVKSRVGSTQIYCVVLFYLQTGQTGNPSKLTAYLSLMLDMKHVWRAVWLVEPLVQTMNLKQSLLKQLHIEGKTKSPHYHILICEVNPKSI